MQESTLIILIIAAFAAGFPALWVAVVFLISRLGGWYRLAGRFPARRAAGGKKFGWSSVRLSLFGNYSMSVNVTVSSDGIHMQPVILFRSGHAPVFIPAEEIVSCTPLRFAMFSSIRLKVRTGTRGAPATITFYGRALSAAIEHQCCPARGGPSRLKPSARAPSQSSRNHR